jgi:hypothetical protein
MQFVITFIVACFLALNLEAQTDTLYAKPLKVKRPNRRFSVFLGGGVSYYLNNMERYGELINPLQSSLNTKFLWEPEHRLRLGIEVSYQGLYTTKLENNLKTNIELNTIPLQFILALQVFKPLTVSYGFGPSILFSKVSAPNQTTMAQTLSLSDMTAAIQYRIKLKKRVSLLLETKYYRAAKADDNAFLFIVYLGYSL